MEFPQFISFTLTSACNLRCKMCGQWSENGYIKKQIKSSSSQMDLTQWKKLVDEIAMHKIRFVLIRGGEAFLYPKIMELLQYINSKGLNLSIDTNGTFIEKYIDDLAKISNMHITLSVDGPEESHDEVRGIKGSFKTMKKNLASLIDLEQKYRNTISKSICFTISKYSYQFLGDMPDVARSMAIDTINIVPYYYFSEETGKLYEEELTENFNCTPFSWKGFQHEGSGIDFNLFSEQHQKYLDNLKNVYSYPYMKLNEEEYRLWFEDPFSIIGSSKCNNIEKLIDIQPDGEANFCVDFPDYSIGNVKESSIKEMWEGEKAEKFRAYRRDNPLSICFKCGAKYISEIKE